MKFLVLRMPRVSGIVPTSKLIQEYAAPGVIRRQKSQTIVQRRIRTWQSLRC